MHETPPTRAELDAIIEARGEAHKKFCEAKEAFESDLATRREALESKKAATQKELQAMRERHDAAMQALGVATVEGTNEEAATAAADEIGAKLYALEARAEKLAAVPIKENEDLFNAVIKAFQESAKADREASLALIALKNRAEEMEKNYNLLAKEARSLAWTGTFYEREIVKLYESIKGPLPGQVDVQKVHALMSI